MQGRRLIWQYPKENVFFFWEAFPKLRKETEIMHTGAALIEQEGKFPIV